MTDSIVHCENITRVFENGTQTVRALDGVSIDIPRGSLTILRGRSGSGKTTLMNILGALDLPTAGKAWFNPPGSEALRPERAEATVVSSNPLPSQTRAGALEITALPEESRDELRRISVGFVFQSVALIGLMSARENVDFSLRVAGMPADARGPRVEECLAYVGLQKRMDHYPHELSGGEQQRVAIARAIAHRPVLLFADEPTAELDTHMGLQVVRLFRDLVHDHGVTVVMTTHDPNMVELADRVYTLEDGRVIDNA
ncbi:MAG: ABC transporter ATP-binding protein [Clostridia bacterium]|nr:ABC transporter ATP-binding protein [Clostridia bacterium]